MPGSLHIGGDLTTRLGDAVGAAHVSRAARELAALGVPAAPGAPPAWIVRPGSASEVAEVVRLAAQAGAVVLPIGAALRRPRVPAAARVLLDVKRMNHVTFLDETSLLVQVQAGATGLALEELLRPRALTLGDFPPAVLRSTLGGMLSVRTPGKNSPRHGFLEDAVLGVSAVLADGRTLHTRTAPRRATGPDLARALLGSEGALGLITGCVLRLHRRPEARLLGAWRLDDFAAAVDAAIAALRKDAQPAALRIFDAAEARAHLGEDSAVLCVATAGPAELAGIDRELFDATARERGGTALGPQAAELWWKRRFGQAGTTLPQPALEIAAPVTRIAAVHAQASSAAREAGRTLRGYASRFDEWSGCLYLTLLDGDKPDPAGPARAAVIRAARDAGGHVAGDRDADMLPYMTALKAKLDPTGVFGELT